MDPQLISLLESLYYVQNTAIQNYLDNRLDNVVEDLDVYERHVENTSVENSEQMSSKDTNNWENAYHCLKPAGPSVCEFECLICLEVAINPMKCTLPEGQLLSDSDSRCKPHMCCYQCLCGFMSIKNLESTKCFVNCTNEFKLPFTAIDMDTTMQMQRFIRHCPNNCGLMGSPIALANHICPLEDPDSIGHTPQAKIHHSLAEENEVLHNKLSKQDLKCKRLQNQVSNYRRIIRNQKVDHADLQKQFQTLKIQNSKQQDSFVQLSPLIESGLNNFVELSQQFLEINLETLEARDQQG